MAVGHRTILFKREEIAERVQALGKQIAEEFWDEKHQFVVISVLKGALPFTADLIRAIEKPLHLEVLVASSYGSGTASSGNVQITYKSFKSLENCNVLLVDDIIDTGYTLAALGDILAAEKPNKIAYCTFLNKPERREADIHVDYVGFDVPDKFIVGYGLDFNSDYRELADIWTIETEGEA